MTEIFENNALDMPQDKGVLNTGEKTEEKMFTQSQLEEILSERLVRERKVNESLLSVKQLLKNISQKGLLKGSSYSEMAKEITEKLSEKCQNENVSTETLSEGGQEPQPIAVADAKVEDNAKENEGGNECEETEKTKENDNSFVGVLCEIKAKYPKDVVEKLLCSNLFESFAKGRSGSMTEIFGDFYSFMSKVNKDESESFAEQDRDYASTAFSSQSGTASAGINLTKQQMDMAKSAGLSYREYAQMLESIPKRTGRTI